MTRILVLNGPNLRSLGRREPEIYGRQSLADIEAALSSEAERLDVELHLFQSNSEAELLDILEAEAGRSAGVLINPGAFSHTSLALLDGLRAFPGPVVEVHLSNVFGREPFRRVMLTAEAADGVILGLGGAGYVVALASLVGMIAEGAE